VENLRHDKHEAALKWTLHRPQASATQARTPRRTAP
jgi:hypothetical protein